MPSIHDMVIFDLVGKLAHFRKFYTNSSSLSYPFPPRTTIEGIIAGILGIERDGYYDTLSPENCSIAVSPRTKVRSLFQTLNYLYVKSTGDLNGRAGRSQNPMEIILPRVFHENLRYRVYLRHNAGTLADIESKLRQNHAYYPTSLGPAQFLGKAEFVARVPAKDVVDRIADDTAEVQTPLVASRAVVDSIFKGGYGGLKLLTDIFPFHFQNGRIPGRNQRLVFDKDFHPLTVSGLKMPVTRVFYDHNNEHFEENIVFCDAFQEDLPT